MSIRRRCSQSLNSSHKKARRFTETDASWVQMPLRIGAPGVSKRIVVLLLCLLLAVDGLSAPGRAAAAPRSSSGQQPRVVDGFRARSVMLAAAPGGGSSSSSSSSAAATALGYFMGTASLGLYLPIIVGIVRRGNAHGVSIQTWMATVLGFSLALIYPVKMKYPLSSYFELVNLVVQSVVILGLVCFHSNLLLEFVGGMGLLAAVAGLLFTRDLSPKLLSGIQMVRLALDSYSLLPQIILNMEKASFSYSALTASMGTGGNLIRVYTTLVLTKDPLLLAGYIIGAASNIILLVQYWLYGSK